MKPNELIKLIEKKGWVLVRSKGSHMHFKKQGEPFLLTVPVHNKDIPTGTLNKLLKMAGLK